MRKIAPLFALLGLLCGCQALHQVAVPQNEKNVSPSATPRKPDVAPQETEEKLPRLLEAISPNSHPRQGEKFSHNGSLLKILQYVGKEKIDENKEVNFYLVIPNSWDNKYMTIAVLSENDYVTDEFLCEGVYSYVGPYSYTTKNKSEKTVRMFVEIPAPADKEQ